MKTLINLNDERIQLGMPRIEDMSSDIVSTKNLLRICLDEDLLKTFIKELRKNQKLADAVEKTIFGNGRIDKI